MTYIESVIIRIPIFTPTSRYSWNISLAQRSGIVAAKLMPNHWCFCANHSVGQLQDQPTLGLSQKSPGWNVQTRMRVMMMIDEDYDVPFWLCCLGMNLGNAGFSWPVWLPVCPLCAKQTFAVKNVAPFYKHPRSFSRKRLGPRNRPRTSPKDFCQRYSEDFECFRCLGRPFVCRSCSWFMTMSKIMYVGHCTINNDWTYMSRELPNRSESVWNHGPQVPKSGALWIWIKQDWRNVATFRRFVADTSSLW